ncbi:DUF3291 domain-containing protein [Streptomyces sp. NPDC057257]|uniref:DUF3291 domain-containing protein n=1 Tax=Streptomyces sp. NPDC057257 TaxID=3346071 RepID=UPI00363CA36E
MPTIPWMPGTAKDGTEPAGPPLVMASRLELRSLLGVPKFFLLSLVVFQQVRRSPGLLGASLKAEPFKRTFWTLSAWRDQEALDAFARTDPHAKSVRGLRPGMKGSVFVFWNTERERLPITWDEAQRRLAEQAEKEAQST